MSEGYHGNREPFLWVECLPEDEAAAEAALTRLAGEKKVYRADPASKKDRKLLEKAAAAVIFYSRASVSRLEETTAAVTRLGKPLLPVYLDAAALSEGMSLLLGTTQGVQRSKFTDDDAFCEAVLTSPVLRELRVTPAQKKAARRAPILGAVPAGAAVLLALLLTLRPFGTRIDPDSALGRLGISGSVGSIRSVYLYGSELADKFETGGACDWAGSIHSPTGKLYLPVNGFFAPRGDLQDVGDFAQLTNLRDLSLAGNQIRDITPLGALTKLRRLDLSMEREADHEDAPPLSLEGVGALKSLEWLNLAYTELAADETGAILGLEELRSLPALKALLLDHGRTALIEQLGETGFEIRYVDRQASTWEELRSACADPAVHAISVAPEASVTIPAGEELTVAPGQILGGSSYTLIIDGTLRLAGCWEAGHGTFRNNGVLVVEDGGWLGGGMSDLYNDGTLTVRPGGTVRQERGLQIVLNGGSLVNEGLISVGVGGHLVWNGGTVENNGVLRLTENYAGIEAAMNPDGPAWRFHGDLGKVTGAGTVEIVSEPAD